MADMDVQLVAVERRLWSGPATFVFARTKEGEIGILPGHEPLLAQLVDAGVVRIDTADGTSVTAAVHGGFLSVTDERVSVLAEVAELAEDIDVARAREALSRAEGRSGSSSEEDAAAAEAARARAAARLQAADESG